MDIYQAKIKRVEERFDSIFSYYLEIPDEFSWELGTNVQIALPGFQDGEQIDEDLVRRLSIMTLNEEGEIGFCTRIREPRSLYKEKLSKLGPGDSLFLFDPISRVKFVDQNRPLVLLSHGVGVTSYRTLVLDYVKWASANHKLHLINVERDSSELFPELRELSGRHGFELHTVADRAAYNQLLESEKELLKESEVFIIGSKEFIVANIKKLRELGVRDEQMHLDKKPEKRNMLFNLADQA
ncbi:MAG: FAD-dependent oxidoreductase [Eubacteriales bacterium]|nr:FAD-dependent oxidoreductase [Eubacteriales bacterium]